MIIDTNYSEVKDGFPVFPTGFHAAKISDISINEKSDGKCDFVVDLIGLEGDAEEKKIRDYIPITTSMLWKFQALLKSSGYPEGMKFDTHDQNCVERLFDQIVKVNVVSEKYEGKEYRKVKSYYSVDDSNTAKMDSGSQSTSHSSKKNNTVDDDDLNF